MSDVSLFIIVVITGILVKLVDQLEDASPKGKRFNLLNNLKYLLAIAYGVLIGYVIVFSSFSTLWLAVLLAQLVTGKIDCVSHFLGFFTAVGIALVLGISNFQSLDFFVFFIFASFDETKFILFPGREFRLWLKFATLFYGLLGRWDYFVAIMLFDSAYYVTGKAFPYINREKKLNSFNSFL